MADVRPFKCWQPRADIVAEVAAAPYDTFSRSEATAEVKTHPLSFLRIDKPAALFESDVDEYDSRVYERARLELAQWYDQGIMVPSSEPHRPTYLVYRLSQSEHTQTGIMACASVADYQKGIIRRHENTRAAKEQDRIEHIKALEAHTGPVLLTYPSVGVLDQLIKHITTAGEPLYDFVAPDGVRHEVWSVDDTRLIEQITQGFAQVPTLYIADGHHRAAAASRIAEMNQDVPGAQYFLVALFSSDELQVLDYNRVIAGTNGQSTTVLLEALENVVDVAPKGNEPYKPAKRGEFGLYVDGQWYQLTVREETRPDDAVEGLDVALLHRSILAPILGIEDPRSDPRISYVGGIRGLKELAARADKTQGVAVALYPCSLAELFAVADAERLMPPKSTWFEPKPKSGLAIHKLEDEVLIP